MATYRDLSIHTLDNRYTPTAPADWSLEELAEYRAFLESSGKDEVVRRGRWESMLAFREEQVDREVTFSSCRLPPVEVLAEIAPERLAVRACYVCPTLPLLSHRLAECLADLQAVGGKPNVAAGRRVLEVLRRMGRRRADMQTLHGGLLLSGRLRVLVLGGIVQIALDNATLAELPAAVALLPLLKRIGSVWLRYVRLGIAYAFRLGMPVSNVSTDSRPALCVPLEDRLGNVVKVVAVIEGRIRDAVLAVLPHQSASLDHALRYATAKQLMRSSEESALALRGRDAAMRCLDRIAPAFKSLRHAPSTQDEITARCDGISRQMIKAYANGRITHVEDTAADQFDVFQDDVGIPHRIGSFRSRGLAVDFERSNRKHVSIRLSLGVAAEQLSYQLAPAN